MRTTSSSFGGGERADATPRFPQCQRTIHTKTTLAKYIKTTLIDTEKKYQLLNCAEKRGKKKGKEKQRFARSLNRVKS
jgi:hypothetical protein